MGTSKTIFKLYAPSPSLSLINGISFNDREIIIISYLSIGWSIKTIAHALKLSPRTVENYVDVIKQKVSTSSRDGIIKFIETEGKLEEFIRHYFAITNGNQASPLAVKNETTNCTKFAFSQKHILIFLLFLIMLMIGLEVYNFFLLNQISNFLGLS